jgi:Zn-dependent protease with chaperone function
MIAVKDSHTPRKEKPGHPPGRADFHVRRGAGGTAPSPHLLRLGFALARNLLIHSPMLDFFARQHQARLNTAKLLPYLLLSIALTTLLLYALCIGAYAIALPLADFWSSTFGAIESKEIEVRFVKHLWFPVVFYSVATLTVALVISATIRKLIQLRKGGWFVAIELGGTRVDPQTENPDERRLRNVVEEMAIASATPVPDVYVLSRENSINAFAAGHSTGDVVIGVTSGALHVLGRDELQGVVAHEFSHILNGDMRLNMRITGIVHGIYTVTLMSYAMMTLGEERAVENKTILEIILDLLRAAVGFLLAFIGFNGALCARIIKSAVCREREFLADAAAVQFTRYPDGLAGALKKAEAWASERISLPAAEEMSHIFFNNLRDDDQLEWTSTHPPVAERIKRLDPMFNKTIAPPEWKAEPQVREGAVPPAPVVAPVIRLEHLASAIEKPLLNRGADILASIPAELMRAAHDSLGARGIIFALLSTPKAQLDALMAAEMERVLPLVTALDVHAKLPLIELTFPALRTLSFEEYVAFSAELKRIIESDQQIDPFEFALQKMVGRHLDPHFKGPIKHTVRHLRLKPLANSCSLLLSVLAHAGQDTPEHAESAFRQGCMTLSIPADDMHFLPRAECDLSRLNAALDELAQAAEGIRNLILNAAVHVISTDGAIRIAEAELLRAIADSLGCAIPPLTIPTRQVAAA